MAGWYNPPPIIPCLSPYIIGCRLPARAARELSSRCCWRSWPCECCERSVRGWWSRRKRKREWRKCAKLKRALWRDWFTASPAPSSSRARVSQSNGLIGQVATLSRDWSQMLVDVTVPSAESVGRALAILEKVCGDFRIDPDWSPALVDGPRVLGIESLTLDGTVLRMILKTAVLRQDDVARELRRRVKLALEQAHILAGNTQRVELISGAAA